MIELVGAALLLAVLVIAVATRKRRRMQRHPAPTFVFADLVRRTMCALSREHGATQVKSMGDGVMIWAPDPGRAIKLAAQAVEQAGSREDLLPVRVGVHTGPAVMQGCDWYGSAVNVAARLAAEAQPNEALISSATRDAARNDDAALADRRELTLRGVARPVSAWRLA